MKTPRSAVFLAVLAGAQTIAAASDLAELLPPTVARWVQLVVGAAGVGVGVYTSRTRGSAVDPVAR